MNLSSLDYGLLFIFKLCVENKSFSKTAEILNVKQPAISYSIKKLEDLLNIKLFERGNYGIEPTDEGNILYEYIAEANNNIVTGLKVVKEISTKAISEIKIGLSLNIELSYLTETIKDLKKLFPEIKISIYTMNEEIMLKDLQSKKVDVVILNSSKVNFLAGVKFKKIKNTKIVCVGLEKYKDIFETSGNTIDEKVQIILPSKNTNLFSKISGLQLKGFDSNNCIYCHSAIVAKKLILSGIGIGYMNEETVKKDIEEGKIFVLSDDISCGTNSIEIASQNKNLNIAVQEFIKIFSRKVVDLNEKNKM